MNIIRGKECRENHSCMTISYSDILDIQKYTFWFFQGIFSWPLTPPPPFGIPFGALFGTWYAFGPLFLVASLFVHAVSCLNIRLALRLYSLCFGLVHLLNSARVRGPLVGGETSSWLGLLRVLWPLCVCVVLLCLPISFTGSLSHIVTQERGSYEEN